MTWHGPDNPTPIEPGHINLIPREGVADMSDGIKCKAHMKRQNGSWFFIIEAPDWVIDDMESQTRCMDVKYLDAGKLHGTVRTIQIVPIEEEPNEP
jgi:hypothetical protein